MTPTTAQITNFILSDELQELSERLKVSDGLLDLISLGENQHTSIIAWMCDSREGHGQGEAILRDLLCHASASAQDRISSPASAPLKGATAKFFEQWTPAKLRTASLSAAVVVKEFADKPDDRLDMLVVDPANRFLIAVENKVNKKISGSQLERYRLFVERTVSKGPLKGFQTAYLVLDKKFDDADADQYAKDVGAEHSHWQALSYEWLNHAALRSTLQVNKGHQAASLIRSYCRQQTGWESDDDKACSGLAATLWTAHSEVVSSLCDMTKRPDKVWAFGGAAAKTTPPDLQLFALQNRDVQRALIEAKGFVAVGRHLRDALPDFTDDQMEHGRVWLDLVPRCLEHLAGKDHEYWPMFLSAYLVDENICNLRFIFNADHLAEGYDGTTLRKWASAFAKGIEKHPSRRRRRIVLATGVELGSLHKEIVKWERRIAELSKSFPLPSPAAG